MSARATRMGLRINSLTEEIVGLTRGMLGCGIDTLTGGMLGCGIDTLTGVLVCETVVVIGVSGSTDPISRTMILWTVVLTEVLEAYEEVCPLDWEKCSLWSTTA